MKVHLEKRSLKQMEAQIIFKFLYFQVKSIFASVFTKGIGLWFSCPVRLVLVPR